MAHAGHKNLSGKTNGPSRKLEVRMPEELRSKLKRSAERNEQTEAFIVRRAIELYLKSHP